MPVVLPALLLQEYLGGGYRSIPTIGPLFLLNAVSSAVVAIGLLAPFERILHDRGAELTSGLLAGAGMARARAPAMNRTVTSR
jgi:hypothetical protein